MKGRRQLKRKIRTRERKKKIYIYCEGENTEPTYFRELGRQYIGALVEVICERETGVPSTLMEAALKKVKKIEASRYIKENGSQDCVWIVFDTDEHPKISEVIQVCKSNNVSVAQSNPCFELWLILHREDFDKPDDRHAVQKKCRDVCEGYDPDRKKIPNLREILNDVEVAEARAETMKRRRGEDGAEYPMTEVYLLTRLIRGAT